MREFTSSRGGMFRSKRLCFLLLRNIAEALVGKGLVKVVRHRQDDDQRSSHYDDLLAAEQRWTDLFVFHAMRFSVNEKAIYKNPACEKLEDHDKTSIGCASIFTSKIAA